MLPEGSPHLVCGYGRYMDGTNPAHFLVDSNPTEDQTKYMEQCTTRVHAVIRKFRELGPNEMECGGLAVIVLFTTMENLHLDVEQSRDKRDVVLAELLRYSIATQGSIAGGVRFGRLLLFLRDLSVFMAWVEETSTLVKVFMDHDLYGFWYDEEPVANGTSSGA
ncbi:hypothetical protein AAVH_27686 [Aphelenchoides avenae]|nr:hypothetical protein AAVH_27686 [Aphelenchus avenae]